MVFGRHSEDVLGKWRYLLLIVSSAMGGAIFHIVVYSTSYAPYIGASAGAAGAAAYYALRFPRAKIGFLYHFGYRYRCIRQPALIVFLSLLMLISFIAYKQIHNDLDIANQISAIATLGGAAVGFVFWLVLLRRSLLSEQ